MFEQQITQLQSLLDSGKAFVEEKKGEWDHIQWDQLLSDIQKNGEQLTDEAKHRFGEILEGLKGIYNEAGKTEGVAKTLDQVKNKVVDFVKANSNGWDQAAWESFLAEIQNSGVTLTNETRAYLSNIAEAARKLVEEQIERGNASSGSSAGSASGSSSTGTGSSTGSSSTGA